MTEAAQDGDGLEIAAVPRVCSVISDTIRNAFSRISEAADAALSAHCLYGAGLVGEAEEAGQQAKRAASQAGVAARRIQRAVASYGDLTQQIAADIAESYRAEEAEADICVDDQVLEWTFKAQRKLRAAGREEAAPARMARQARHDAAQAAASALPAADDPAKAAVALTQARIDCSEAISNDIWAILTEAKTAFDGTELAFDNIRHAHRALAAATRTESYDETTDPYVASALGKTLSSAEMLPAAQSAAKEALDEASATLFAAQAAYHAVEDILVECRSFAEQALACAAVDGVDDAFETAAATVGKARGAKDAIGVALDDYIEARAAFESSVTASITAVFAAFS